MPEQPLKPSVDGLECPECGCFESRVTRTRHRRFRFHGEPVSTTIRWRVCQNCFAEFRTYEQTIESDAK